MVFIINQLTNVNNEQDESNLFYDKLHRNTF